MNLELGRLVGRVPAMIVVMGIFDKIKDALDSWVDGLGERFSDAMGRFASYGIRATLDFYTNSLLPDASVFEQGKLSQVFGSFNGLAVVILTISVLIATLATLVAVARNKRAEFAGRTTLSIIRFFLYVFLFFPVYTTLLTLIATLGGAYLKLSAGISDDASSNEVKDQIVAIMVPDDLLLQALTGFVNGLVMLILIIQGFVLLVIGILTAITHSASIAFSPFGDPGLNQYKFSVGVLWTVPLSIIAVTILLGLDVLMLASTANLWPSSAGASGFFGSLAFGILMIVTPYVIGYLMFTKVVRSITNGDNRIQNAIDIATMPSVEAKNIEGASQRQSQSIVAEFATGLPTAIASGANGPGTEALELAKQIGIQRAMASANPIIAAGTVAYTGYKTIQSFKKAASDDAAPTAPKGAEPTGSGGDGE